MGCGSELTAFKEENATLKTENEQLKTELEELKNGAEQRITEIRKFNSSNDEESVLRLSTELHNKFPDSEQDKEAQGYVMAINEKRKQAEETARIAKEKAAAEALKSAQDKAREIIRVKNIRTGNPNSAGGVDLYINWINNSEKTIKYAIFFGKCL